MATNGQSVLNLARRQAREEELKKTPSYALIGRSRPECLQDSPIPSFLPIKCPETGQPREVELEFAPDFHRGQILTVGLFKIVGYRQYRPGVAHGQGSSCAYREPELLKQFILCVLRFNLYLDSDFRYPTIARVVKEQRMLLEKQAQARLTRNTTGLPTGSARAALYACRPKKRKKGMDLDRFLTCFAEARRLDPAPLGIK